MKRKTSIEVSIRGDFSSIAEPFKLLYAVDIVDSIGGRAFRIGTGIDCLPLITKAIEDAEFSSFDKPVDMDALSYTLCTLGFAVNGVRTR